MDIRSILEQPCTVVLPAGGEGSRLRSETDAGRVHKSAISLKNGFTMLEYAVAQYRDAGVQEFVLLTYHGAQSVQETLGDGSSMGVRITYSEDPERPVGRGGAIKHALETGALRRDGYVFVHNPDDLIVRYAGNFVHDLARHHKDAEARGHRATIVAVKGTRYPYTGFFVAGDVVESIETYPFINVPAHVGITLLSPSALELFAAFDLGKKTDFEPVIFPRLTAERQLSAMLIDEGCWIAVNEPKSLQQLRALIEAGEL
jgi:NDP-sugar pyrophosphorylase family protein